MKKNELKKLGLSIKEFNKICKSFAKCLEKPKKEEIDKRLWEISIQLPYDYATCKTVYDILKDYDSIIKWCNWCSQRAISPDGYLENIQYLIFNEPKMSEIIKTVMS